MTSTQVSAPSVDPQEVAYYERLAHLWWDAEGPFWPLHALNGFRANYIRERLAADLGRDPASERPLEGLRVLDIGCGGGILSESIARLGARVTGVDVTQKNVSVARLHAESGGLAIDYRLASVDQLAAEGARFDVVLNMEVVEHVDRLPEFLADCGRLVEPGGKLFVASINRTWAAYAIAILGAEYVLRWLPRGTHHYRKLVAPGEVRRYLGDGFVQLHGTGVRINPLTRRFSYTRWLGVNYMLLLQRQES
ncbi:bifunctional 2-polyprenyl-6-hydroxyphenol methylase/3-demethylubiquinol 3-O-methyltransferase UbiG [Imhoffiella purpurea]|uniref:Ubiquinone biosynthesis O-methyltransferase n=1 Tax=Imhoffiella purpurea TaxID=1249627 RepID=W9VH00_9GAMM|nr:bifunctional 2-polyprenyl-6-hydroxyphenol methylase/3-demethylubiquinol 3-O-methyltransferase UbiG [Imhoffiella purpurea]EXJ16296.1 3-demethylubiquinone-9 3-methyltransferase [Imhoffiella purpurea]